MVELWDCRRLCTKGGVVAFVHREAHMKSSKAELQTRAGIQEKIAALEDNTSLLKDYSWLSQAGHPSLQPALQKQVHMNN